MEEKFKDLRRQLPEKGLTSPHQTRVHGFWRTVNNNDLITVLLMKHRLGRNLHGIFGANTSRQVERREITFVQDVFFFSFSCAVLVCQMRFLLKGLHCVRVDK